MSEALALTKALIERPSVTPDDQGCQQLIAERLQKLDFQIEHLAEKNVENLWAQHGDAKPLIVFAGHTDVVPAGNVNEWHSDPFQATIKDNKLYGRGACDMKAAVAAMVVAIENFVKQYPQHQGAIGLLLTSDEEGPALHGTQAVVKKFKQAQRQFDYCIIGEPSSSNDLADTIKVGRRGSLTGTLKIHGKQGHIAYPEKLSNPIHSATPFLQALLQQQWDSHTVDNFPATSFQIANINAGLGVTNVTPAELTVDFNFRYSPASTAEELILQVETLLDQHQLNYEINWRHSGKPFFTKQDSDLISAAVSACQQTVDMTPELSTNGGTSDGRFIFDICDNIIELGLPNTTIHQINEHILTADIDKLTQIYYRLLEQLLPPA